MELFTVPRPDLLTRFKRKFSDQKEHLAVSLVNNPARQETEQNQKTKAELLVVGGGIAGLQAAILASKSGISTLLIEQSARLGGMCDYYGRAESDEDPSELINRLCAEVIASENISVMLNTRAVDAHANKIVAEHTDNGVKKYLEIVFDKAILATGALYDRFANLSNVPNRAWRAAQSFRLAVDYGVMPPKEAHIVTGGNSGYRLAHLFKENGIDIQRVWDPRPSPNSRHIDFAKAIGVIMSQGQALSELLPDKIGVKCKFTPSVFGGAIHEHTLPAVLISDAPVPDIELWSKLGGMVDYDSKREALYPSGALERIEIIGSAAGAITQRDCLEQAKQAIASLSGIDERTNRLRLGDYQHEDFPKALTALHGGPLLERMRSTADVPSFVAPPNEKACTEFAFNRIVSSFEEENDERTSRSNMDQSSKVADHSGFYYSIMLQRTDTARPYELQPMRNLALQEGQAIYDTDGVSAPTNRIGVIVGRDGKLFGLIDGDKIASGHLVYVRTRTGLNACQIK